MIRQIQTEQPNQTLRHEVAQGIAGDVFAIAYDFSQTFLPGAPVIKLIALVSITAVSPSREFRFAIFQRTEEIAAGLSKIEPTMNAAQRFSKEHGSPWFDLRTPWQLQPIKIPKPWGQEIWYTGIEARGQSQIGTHGLFIPLPWLLSFANESIGVQGHSLILLKILDPLPVPVFGDLYFEMHQQKREVYVVTNIDSSAWPDGVGGIRFGFDQQKRQESTNDEHFKQQYLSAVAEYRLIREEIDKLLDACRIADEIDLVAAVDAKTTQAWLRQVPDDLLAREHLLRERMESFIHVQPLQLGDVIKVPTLTPHSLLHGVRTVEFQTPVYERKILSFAQKVLTQNHWDTADAMAEVSLDAPQLPTLPVLLQEQGLLVESVVTFEDFTVERVSLSAGAEYTCPRQTYLIIMGVSGNVSVDRTPLSTEEAFLCGFHQESTVPSHAVIANKADESAVILLARPKIAL